MNGTSFDWDDLRLFLLVAGHGGLAEASRRSGVSPPTLSRRMEKFERDISSRLFHRHARGYDLTEQGQKLLELATVVEQKMQRVEHARLGDPTHETVRISAGSWISLFLIRNIDRLHTPHDRFRLALSATEAKLDIARREAVIGLRNQKPDQTALEAKLLGTVRFAAYSHPDATPGWVGVSVDTKSARWLRATHGHAIHFEVSAPRNALDLALLGKGSVVLPCCVGDRETGLQRLGDPIAELDEPIWLALHSEERHMSGPRAVISRLETLFANRALTD